MIQRLALGTHLPAVLAALILAAFAFVVAAGPTCELALAESDDGQLQATENEEMHDSDGLSAQSSNYSDYAIFKSDGYVYPCDSKGNVTSQYWTKGTDNPSKSDAVQALNAVKVVFIASDIVDVPYRGIKAKYQYISFGKLYDDVQGIGFNGDWPTSGFTANLERIVFLTDANGQSQVTNLESDCFEKLSSLTSVENLNKTQIRVLSSRCFSKDERLESITLPNTCTEIQSYAFNDCKRLDKVNLGTSLQRVKEYAFTGCSRLSRIDFPESFLSLGNRAFTDCSNLTKVVLKRTTNTVTASDSMSGIFYGTPIYQEDGEGRIYVPNALLSDYKEDSKNNSWQSYISKISPFLEIDSIKSVTYDGKEKKPAVTVRWIGDKLAASNYTLKYSNNVKVGTATVTATGKGSYKGTAKQTFEIKAAQAPKQSMHRLYNPNSGEHFYTADDAERDNLVSVGWNSEGEGWTAPTTSNTPVYRMYNPNAGEHHYTTDASEKDGLVAVGWNYEGVGWYSDDGKSVPLYRDYNPNAFSNNHNYTADKSEHDWLIGLGWNDEGIGWYGV